MRSKDITAMNKTDDSIETGWKHHTLDIPDKGLEVVRDANPGQLAEAAGYLDIPGVERLHVRYRIERRAEGGYQLSGDMRALVVQACGITLEPVRTDLREVIEVEFRPADDMPASVEHEQQALEAIEHEPIVNQVMAAGRVVLETLLAALPPFPRVENATLEQTEAGPAEVASGGAFAGLASWKPKPK
jgi:hypothetical protein